MLTLMYRPTLLLAQPRSFYAFGIAQLPEHWKKCVVCEGDYLEKVQFFSKFFMNKYVLSTHNLIYIWITLIWNERSAVLKLPLKHIIARKEISAYRKSSFWVAAPKLWISASDQMKPLKTLKHYSLFSDLNGTLYRTFFVSSLIATKKSYALNLAKLEIKDIIYTALLRRNDATQDFS